MVAARSLFGALETEFDLSPRADATQQVLRCRDGIQLNNRACPPSGLRGAGMWIRLTRRLAGCIDGVNVSAHQVGDVFEVTRREGDLVVAEAWAVVVTQRARPFRSRPAATTSRPTDEHRPRPSVVEQLRHMRQRIQQGLFEPHDHRRAEDRIRDEWHDEHARVLNDEDLSS